MTFAKDRIACSANDGQLTEAVISNFDPAPHPVSLVDNARIH
jgi:hypothetical protein